MLKPSLQRAAREALAQAPDLPELRSHLEAAGVARQKWPEELIPVEDFPRTSTGKIQKYVLRDRLRDEVS